MQTPIPEPDFSLSQLRTAFAVSVREVVDESLGQRLQVMCSSPPGFGKTTAVLNALTDRPGRCRVLWFTPETKDGSLAAEIERLCHERKIPVRRLHEKRKQSAEIQNELTCWEDRQEGAEIRVLAHAYLPLLCTERPHSSVGSLPEADLIVIDEAPLSSLMLSFGGPQDARSTLPCLQLPQFLSLLGGCGQLLTTPEAAETAVERLLSEAGWEVAFSHKKGLAVGGTFLSDVTRQHLILPLRPAALRAIEEQWKRDAPVPEPEDLSFVLERSLNALAEQLTLLGRGEAHGLTLVRHPDGVSYLHVSALHRPVFRQSVIHLDAYPHELTLQRWLPGARLLDAHAGVEAAGLKVPVRVLTTEEERYLYVSRQNVDRDRSEQRHRAAIHVTASLAGTEVLYIVNKRFLERVPLKDFQLLARPGQSLKVLHWFSGRGRDNFRAHDLILLNEPRLPHRMAKLDYASLQLDEAEAEAFREHQEAAEFLQLLFRGRPLSYPDTRIFCVFDPGKLYRSEAARALIERTLILSTQGIPISIRKKSEAILGLLQIQLLAGEAARVWGACPVSLLLRFSGRTVPKNAELTGRLDGFIEEAGQRDARLSPGAWEVAVHPQVKPDLRNPDRPRERLSQSVVNMLTGDGYREYSCPCGASGKPGRPETCRAYARSSEDAQRFWKDWPRCR